MRKLINGTLVGLVPIVLLSSGCASMTGTTAQSVSIQTRDQVGKEVNGANCELTNNKGRWFITTPGSATIVRSNDDMQVLCNKEGHEPGRAAVVSATKGAMFGNILLGGGIGALIDHNSGAAYEYPSYFQVLMGSSIRVEPPKEAGQAEQTQPAVDRTSLQPATGPAQQPTTPQPVITKIAAPPPSVQPQSTEERLKELKRLREAGLISEDVYIEQQRKALESR